MLTKDYLLSYQPIVRTQIPLEKTHVDESDTGPDRIWSDPTIRRNPIENRVAEQLTDPTVKS